MKSSTSILVYGHDPMLNSSRCAILQGAGFRVVSASNLNEVQAFCSKQSISLIVFCQNVSSDEAKMVVFVALAFNPKTFVLTLNEIVSASNDEAAYTAANDCGSIGCLTDSSFLIVVEKAVLSSKAIH